LFVPSILYHSPRNTTPLPLYSRPTNLHCHFLSSFAGDTTAQNWRRGQFLLCKILQLIRHFPTPLLPPSLASDFAEKEIRVPKGIEANSSNFLLWPISLAASCFKHAAISSLPPDNAVTSASVNHLIREIGASRGHSGQTRTEGYQVRSIEGRSLFLLTCSWRGKGGHSPIRNDILG